MDLGKSVSMQSLLFLEQLKAWVLSVHVKPLTERYHADKSLKPLNSH